MKRLGILGGSFNPIHLGHLHLAESVRNELNLDKVLFIPTGINPFKNKNKEISDFERYEMVKMAIGDNPYFDISDIEISQEGKSYTIDTMKALNEIYPDTELFFITGADIMFEITRWREAETLLKMVTFVACCRPGYSQRKLDRRIEELKKEYDAKIIKLFPSQMEIASSAIRQNIAKGFSVRYLLPECVEQYIAEGHLYTDQYDPSRVEEEKIKVRLKAVLKPSRYEHTLQVTDCAGRLAEKYHSDVKKARLAGLLHDCAKHFTDEQLIQIMQKEKMAVDPIVTSAPHLLHGPVGSLIAQKEFGVEDQDILNAITYHTTGRVGMSDLEKIIYLADYIEPGRDFPGVEALREAVEKDLDEAMIVALSCTINYITSIGGLIHSDTIDTRNYYLMNQKGKA